MPKTKNQEMMRTNKFFRYALDLYEQGQAPFVFENGRCIMVQIWNQAYQATGCCDAAAHELAAWWHGMIQEQT